MSEQILTKLSPRKRFYCSSGSEYENTYQEEINKKTGRLGLVKTGRTNVYAMIQEDLEQSKIENIIHKLAMNDLSVLKEANLTYVDASDYPQNLMEAQNIVVKAKAEFDKLPAEVRKEFNNSPEQYVSEMGTKEFIEKLSPYNEKIAAAAKEKSEEEYNNRVNEAAKFNNAVEAAMKGAEE